MRQIREVEEIMQRVERESPEMSEAQRRLSEADAILALSDDEILRKAAGGKS